MNEEQIIKFLQDNLKIDVEQEVGLDNDIHTEIKILLKDEEITSTFIDINYGQGGN